MFPGLGFEPGQDGSAELHGVATHQRKPCNVLLDILSWQTLGLR